MHARIDAVYRVSFAITGDEDDARDATQETFVAAWRQIRGLRDVEQFDAWLQRIAVNAARMTLRARGRRRVREIPSGDVAALAAVADQRTPADRPMPTDWASRCERLPVEQREILVLHHLEGTRVAEIAGIWRSPSGRSSRGCTPRGGHSKPR